MRLGNKMRKTSRDERDRQRKLLLFLWRSWGDIVKIPTNFLDTFPVALTIAIFGKLSVTAVDGPGFPGMLDGTPVLFRPGGDFPHIRDEAVEIAAIDTIELFDDIEIRQGMTVNDDIIPRLTLGMP